MVIKIIILVLADHRNLKISDKDSSSSIYFSEFVSIFESLYLKLVDKTSSMTLTEKAKTTNEACIIKVSEHLQNRMVKLKIKLLPTLRVFY